MNKTLVVLVIILLLGLFFRTYKLEIFYPWGHDQDLFAWIAKDIMIDGHFRLIGQETSVTGVFIGPLFYYLMAFSMAIFNMNPMAANIPTTIISLLTIFSIYFVFEKFFSKKVGLIGAFLYSASPGIILLDRWVVPTQTTNLWCIWFLFVCFSVIKGKFPLIILGILMGLIWHVHVAFIPLLILLPICFWLSSKNGYKFKINFKSFLISISMFFILTLPFFAFEIRHGFQQIKGLTRATYEEKGDIKVDAFLYTACSFDRVWYISNFNFPESFSLSVLSWTYPGPDLRNIFSCFFMRIRSFAWGKTFPEQEICLRGNRTCHFFINYFRTI